MPQCFSRRAFLQGLAAAGATGAVVGLLGTEGGAATTPTLPTVRNGVYTFAPPPTVLTLGWTNTQASPQFGLNPAKTDAITALQALAATPASGQAPVLNNTYVYYWGLADPDPYPGGTYAWTSLDNRMRFIASIGGIPVITLCASPNVFLPAAYGCGGTPEPNCQGDAPSDFAGFAALAGAIAARYAPNNPSGLPAVARYQIWSELRGFNGNVTSYGTMYAQLHDAIKTANPSALVGGPYISIHSYAADNGGPVSGPWGYTSAGTFNALEQFMASHGSKVDILCVDGENQVVDSAQPYLPGQDEFSSSQKYFDVTQYLRRTYGKTMWWSEFYAQPPGTSWTVDHQAAAITCAAAYINAAGAAGAMVWGSEPDTSSAQMQTRRPALTYTTATGSLPASGTITTPMYDSFLQFVRYFGKNAALPLSRQLVINTTTDSISYRN